MHLLLTYIWSFIVTLVLIYATLMGIGDLMSIPLSSYLIFFGAIFAILMLIVLVSIGHDKFKARPSSTGFLWLLYSPDSKVYRGFFSVFVIIFAIIFSSLRTESKKPQIEVSKTHTAITETQTKAPEIRAAIPEEKKTEKPDNATRGLDWLHREAAQGNTEVENELGAMYASGNNVQRDEAKALDWFQKAATHGNSLAQYNLGTMYLNGVSVQKDYEKATNWFRKAAEQGDLDALFTLGKIYEQGLGVVKSDKAAAEWYQQAAVRGHAFAQYNLALMYEEGRGVIKSNLEAAEWLRESVARGNILAIAKLQNLRSPKSGERSSREQHADNNQITYSAYKWKDQSGKTIYSQTPPPTACYTPSCIAFLENQRIERGLAERKIREEILAEQKLREQRAAEIKRAEKWAADMKRFEQDAINRVNRPENTPLFQSSDARAVDQYEPKTSEQRLIEQRIRNNNLINGQRMSERDAERIRRAAESIIDNDNRNRR